LILSKGKKPYLLAVGKPNVAKLGNFLEIDVFCLVACPENSLLDSREFLKPIVTPYELMLAFGKNLYWNPSFYQLDFGKVLNQVEESLELMKDEDQGSSDEEPHFSLITGGYGLNKHFVSSARKEEEGQDSEALVKRWDGTVSQYSATSAAAQFLNQRSFQGLEQDLGSAVAELEIGRAGVAKGYSHED
jgi:diphthamide biosynthesis protein 2